MKKKGAMEMSVGTIVTIVLLMAVLVLGIFLVQRIFRSSTGAIDAIDSEVQSEIQKLFAEEDAPVAVFPTSREITLKKGDDPKGFAFAVRNPDKEGERTISYEVKAQGSGEIPGCGSLTTSQADGFLIGGEGEFDLGPGSTLNIPRLVRFSIPEGVASCSFFYNIDLTVEGEGDYSLEDVQVFVTIK